MEFRWSRRDGYQGGAMRRRLEWTILLMMGLGCKGQIKTGDASPGEETPTPVDETEELGGGDAGTDDGAGEGAGDGDDTTETTGPKPDPKTPPPEIDPEPEIARPPEPTGLAVSRDSTSQLTVSWVSGGGATTGFVLAYAASTEVPADCASGTVVSQETLGDETSHVLTPLPENTDYAFRIC